MTLSDFPSAIGVVSRLYPNVAQIWKLANGIQNDFVVMFRQQAVVSG